MANRALRCPSCSCQANALRSPYFCAGNSSSQVAKSGFRLVRSIWQGSCENCSQSNNFAILLFPEKCPACEMRETDTGNSFLTQTCRFALENLMLFACLRFWWPASPSFTSTRSVADWPTQEARFFRRATFQRGVIAFSRLRPDNSLFPRQELPGGPPVNPNVTEIPQKPPRDVERHLT
jgi:hypothetical protein